MLTRTPSNRTWCRFPTRSERSETKGMTASTGYVPSRSLTRHGFFTLRARAVVAGLPECREPLPGVGPVRLWTSRGGRPAFAKPEATKRDDECPGFTTVHVPSRFSNGAFIPLHIPFLRTVAPRLPYHCHGVPVRTLSRVWLQSRSAICTPGSVRRTWQKRTLSCPICCTRSAMSSRSRR